MWDASATLWQRLQCILMAKYVVLPCHQEHRLALFLMMRRVVVVDGWYFTGGRFFFSFLLFSLSHQKFTHALFSFHFSVLVLRFFIADFSPWPFWEIFWCFQFHHWITICHELLFAIWSLFFWFLIFLLTLF